MGAPIKRFPLVHPMDGGEDSEGSVLACEEISSAREKEASSVQHGAQVTGPSNHLNSVGTVIQGRVIQSTAVTASTAKVPRVRPDGMAKQESPAFVPPA